MKRFALVFMLRNGLRKSLAEYTSNTSIPYAFDPDHAVVAYPLFALQVIGSQLKAAGLPMFEDGEQTFLRTRTKDSSGVLSMLLGELKRLALVK